MMVVKYPKQNESAYLHREEQTKATRGRALVKALWPLRNITRTHAHDVLLSLGKNGGKTTDSGNTRYRQLAEAKIAQYNLRSTKTSPARQQEMALILATDLVKSWRDQKPPGRFLRCDANGLWYDVGNAFALKKTTDRIHALLGKRVQQQQQQQEGGNVKDQTITPTASRASETRKSCCMEQELPPSSLPLLPSRSASTSSLDMDEIEECNSFEDCLSSACGQGRVHPTDVTLITTSDGTECQASFAPGSSVSITMHLPSSFLSVSLVSSGKGPIMDPISPFHVNSTEISGVNFQNCPAITTIYLLDSEKEASAHAGDFRGCSTNVALQLPPSISPYVGSLAYVGSSSVITSCQRVPGAVTVMYEYSFLGQSPDHQSELKATIAWASDLSQEENAHPNMIASLSIFPSVSQCITSSDGQL